MSSKDFLKVIEDELARLNDRIDVKILKGRSYTKEATRHKFLLRELRRLESSIRISPYIRSGEFNPS
ncbi:MAG TPA: hypothetical protein VJI33_04150 [Candidatus Paceibacterota bacterium]